MITVANSRMLIKMSIPSALSLLKRSVRWMTSSGNLKCHQNLNAIENPPVRSRLLLPIVVAKGVHGMRYAIGISQLICESGLSLLQKKLSLWCIVLLILYWYIV